jgi:hypothetical protein
MITGCGPVLDSPENKSNELMEESQTIISRLRIKDIQGNYFLPTSIDSIEKKWALIFEDSAELGYQFIHQFDSLFEERNEAEKEKLLTELNKEIKTLERNFTYKEDEFRDLGFYTHKRWGRNWANRKTLTSGVNSNGYAWLRSNYSAGDWLFHTSITVLVGEDKYQSDNVPTYSEDNKTDNTADRIWEVVTYENTDILKAIATNVKKTVKVRFNGREFYDDHTLSSGDKQALKDCYDLGEAIKKRRKLEQLMPGQSGDK